MKTSFRLSWIVVLLLTSCSAIKYLPEKDLYLDKAELVIKSDELSRQRKRLLAGKLTDEVGIKANKKFLGSRPAVWFYNIVGEPKEYATVKRYIKTALGTPPALYSEAQPVKMSRLIEQELHNAGHFRSKVTYDTSTNQKKRSSAVKYTVTVTSPYHVSGITYDLAAYNVYAGIIPHLAENSILQKGQQYNFEKMKNEIARVVNVFKNAGFYFFHERFLVFEADSTVGNHSVDLTMKFSEEPSAKAKTIYSLNPSNVYFSDQLIADSSSISTDTIVAADMTIYHDVLRSPNVVRPSILSMVSTLDRGSLFSLSNDNTSRQRFQDLGYFQMLRIIYTSPSSDSALLTPNIFLVPKRKKSLNSTLEFVSKSNGTIGPVGTITFTNRNLFEGAEKFDLSLSGAYETQISSGSNGSLNAFEAKLESSLAFKRLVTPFRIKESEGDYLPGTTISGGINLQNRLDYYNISSFHGGISYSWRTSKSTLHEFAPLEANYVKTSNISEEFAETLLLNPTLALSLQDQFILDTKYTFSINTQQEVSLFGDADTPDSKRNPIAFRTSIEQSGNVLEMLMKTTAKDEERPREILGSPYSQYLKGDMDFRHFWEIHPRHKIVSNISTGLGYSYGNAETMPYIKQYSLGGASTLRSFPARSVGPGTYSRSKDPAYSDDSITFTDQYADIKLQLNIEYRINFHKIFKGALFIDAGNIWTLREDTARVGSQFKADQFYKQLAIGAGIGLRLDFRVFVLRFDTGVTLRRPDEGWVTKSFNFSDPAWRRENIIMNIGIGYPF